MKDISFSVYVINVSPLYRSFTILYGNYSNCGLTGSRNDFKISGMIPGDAVKVVAYSSNRHNELKSGKTYTVDSTGSIHVFHGCCGSDDDHNYNDYFYLYYRNKTYILTVHYI